MKVEDLRARLGTLPPLAASPPAPAFRVEEDLRLTVVAGGSGDSYVVDTVRGPEQRHGQHTFGAVGSIAPERLGAISNDPDIAHMDIRRTVFLDTETTGLGYGVGTYVFLVGIGHCEGDVFRVRQFFLRNPAEEVAMLAALADYLEPFTCVVSYNGRAFDWPLLESRYLYQQSRLGRGDVSPSGVESEGMPGDPPAARPSRAAPSLRLQPVEPIHLDLLHVARRLWQARLPSCALSSIEQHVLQVRRTEEDVPGWMIPELYFQYLRTGNASPLRRVFYHNLHDILSLASLAIHVDRLAADPWGGLTDHGVDFFSLGKLYERAGDWGYAGRCYEEALRRGLDRDVEGETLLRLALLEKRRGQWDAAIDLWLRLLERAGTPASRSTSAPNCPTSSTSGAVVAGRAGKAQSQRLLACVELAKYYEHVELDFEQALAYTTQALEVGSECAERSWPETREEALRHRSRRLLRRLEK